MDSDEDTLDLETMDKTLAVIESSIRTLLQKLQQIRVARNRLISINRLPPELLVKIFSIIGTSWSDRSGHRLLQLTWVSHYWRNLALESPNLWTLITNSNLPQADVWVARSKHCPLSIGLSEIPKALAKVWIPNILTVLLQFHRTEHLRITLHRCYISLSSEWLKDSSGSLLKSLELESVWLPDGFLHRVPNIGVMYLRRCQHSWPAATHLPNLTSLHILFPRLCISVLDFVTSLNRLPQLEHLILAEVFLPLQESTSLARPLLEDGPCLSLLKLGSAGDTEPYLWFLQCINSKCITSRTTISCNFNLSSFTNSSPFQRLLSSIDELFLETQSINSINFKGLTFTVANATAHAQNPFLLLNYRHKDVEPGSTPPSRTSISIELNPTILSRTTLLLLQQNVVLTHLQALRWRDLMYLDLEGILNTFGVLSKVEYVDLQVHPTLLLQFLRSIVIRSAGRWESMTPASDQPIILFSAMRILGIQFNEQSFPLLGELLSNRKSANLALETLIFTYVPDDPDMDLVDPLKESVGQLVFGGSTEVKAIEEMLEGAGGLLEGCDLEPLPDD
ncbi:hypothetical protein BDN72DRAFT_478923 [Pluteus cervinus]|uniref:Uncharacterized protein n=1 Tax=Pluteus cervinus TaxID=181527 RepID=A0ACD3A6Q7_9AGAR|nr:hypothetical protein BDN72DRAFT_478923 [Pluteus cervinus]